MGKPDKLKTAKMVREKENQFFDGYNVKTRKAQKKERQKARKVIKSEQ